MTFDLNAYLKERKLLVEEALEHYLPPQKGFYNPIVEAMRYSLFAGGKRLRPILCLAATEIVGGKKETALPVACALEMIHTYSLIHDDLPAMDNDDFRRGKPTNHRVFGEAMAILAGDGLLTEAFYLLTYPDLLEKIPPAQLVWISHLIAQAAGFRGMVSGQVMDLEATGKEIGLEELKAIHDHKTGALIRVAVESGAIIGGGNKTEVEALKEYGTQIGLAFQIVDDVLDIEGNPEDMGKNIGSDEPQQKATYPKLVGLNEAKEMAQTCIKRGIHALKPFGERAMPLKALAQYIIERRG
ncbi:MAG: Farnesyl diphosphate synthase [Candidatus Methanoperedenaceae archaeon GB50]|nr:MAG: Farnesyl diphosphate synthase [Candidatus Methanoperedenaceae archaeon GB50]CAD7783768.1 MAG: Farnesyl diphosphate synthase [Candidatus Methanoperedenaceae archaeon GB37]HEC50080.1 polyprenyl synthetase family protein [Candidatus Desulfofervidus auxilii]